MKPLFTIYVLTLLICNYTFAKNTYNLENDNSLSLNTTSQLVTCDKPFENPEGINYGDFLGPPVGSNGLPIPDTRIYPPPQLSPALEPQILDYDSNPIEPEFENIAHEFDIKLFANIKADIYNEGSIYFDALKKLLVDTEVLFYNTSNGAGPIYVNSPSTILLPSNTAFQKYLEEKGFTDINELYDSDPLEFRNIILSHISPKVFLYEYLFYFEEKNFNNPLRSSMGDFLSVSDNCIEAFINGIKVVKTETAIYEPEHGGSSYIHFIEGVLLP